MDEHFLLPSAPVALPRACWWEKTFTVALMLVQPTTNEFKRVEQSIAPASPNKYNMKIGNQFHVESAAEMPHRTYIMQWANFADLVERITARI